MFVATPSRVVDMANDTHFDETEGYLHSMVAPTMCETAVIIAAVGAGAAVVACACYVANGWANNVGHRHGHHQHVEDMEAFRGLDVANGSVAALVDARAEALG